MQLSYIVHKMRKYVAYVGFLKYISIKIILNPHYVMLSGMCIISVIFLHITGKYLPAHKQNKIWNLFNISTSESK